MNLMVPTFMCKALSAIEFDGPKGRVAPGEIVDVAYGHALVLKAMGGVTALVDEQETHLKAQEELAMYGADSWFPHRNQTISRVADYLAAAGFQNNTVN